MEKKGIVIRIAVMVICVVLLAIAARMWLNANGLEHKSSITVSDPPADCRVLEEELPALYIAPSELDEE